MRKTRTRSRRGRGALPIARSSAALEERQKDLEQEIADIHDLLRRLRDEGADSRPTEPAPAI